MTDKLTVVMLNWKRPCNVRRFTQQYLKMGQVAEVIVWDNAPYDGRLHLKPADQKFKYICAGDDHARDLGLPTRFAAAALARTDAILLVDDDIELPEATVNALFDAWKTRDCVVGIFGRQPAISGRYTPGDNVYGDVPIVLTRAAVVNRRSCAVALCYVTDMALALGGEPFGNGEDIVLSYTVMMNRPGFNLALKLPYKNVGYDDQHAISVRYPQHAEHRTRVVSWCRQHIAGGKLGAALLDGA